MYIVSSISVALQSLRYIYKYFKSLGPSLHPFEINSFEELLSMWEISCKIIHRSGLELPFLTLWERGCRVSSLVNSFIVLGKFINMPKNADFLVVHNKQVFPNFLFSVEPNP